MRSILVIALAANIFFSVEAGYVRATLTGHSAPVAGKAQK
jgi:hypothetical protein